LAWLGIAAAAAAAALVQPHGARNTEASQHVLSIAAGGDGAQLYASCLTFYDRVPSELCAKHEDLLGAVALKAMCLLSKRPYLDTSQQVVLDCGLQLLQLQPPPNPTLRFVLDVGSFRKAAHGSCFECQSGVLRHPFRQQLLCFL
jgi:hypothetical protein